MKTKKDHTEGLISCDFLPNRVMIKKNMIELMRTNDEDMSQPPPK
jgi:hypothetical protein